jgi:class 3 adenylate cyclase
MSGTDPYAETLLANGSDVGESLSLPTGMVTLLLADIEGSTRLWDTQPEATAAALELLDRTVADIVAAFRGLPPTGRQVPRCGFPVGVDVVTGLLQHYETAQLAPTSIVRGWERLRLVLP